MDHAISGLDSNTLGNIPETIDAGSIDSIIETNDDAKSGKEAMNMRESTGPLDLNSTNSPESPNSAQMKMEEDGSLIPASPNSSGKEEVAQWLMTLNLEYLIDIFFKQGYDDMNVMRELNEQDLDALGIDKTGVRKKLILYVKKLRNRNKPDDVLEEDDDGSLESVSGDGSEPSLGDSQLGGPITGRKRSLGSSLDSSREKKRKKKRRSPYRCSKCCMFKVQSINKHNSHKCDEKLIGHTFENCPTQNLRAHPEEQESRRKQKASDRKKKEKRTKKPKPEGMTSVSPVKGVVATGNSGNTMGVDGVTDDKVDINGLSNVDWDTFRERELRKMSQTPYAGLFNGPQRTQGMLMIVQKYYDLKNKVEEMKSKKKRVDYVDTADLSSLVDPSVEGNLEVMHSSLEDHQSVGGSEGDQGYSQTHGTVPGVVGGGHSNLPLLVSGEQGHHSEIDSDHQHELMNHVGQVLSSTLANQHSHQHAHHTGAVLEDKEDRISG